MDCCSRSQLAGKQLCRKAPDGWHVPTICPGGHKCSRCAGRVSKSIGNRQTEVAMILNYFALCPFCSPTNAVLGSLLCRRVSNSRQSLQQPRGQSPQPTKGSEQAGFVQPIFNYLEGVNKDEITLFSEAHNERRRRHFLLQVCWSTGMEFVEISLEIFKIYSDSALRTQYDFELGP